MDTGAWWATVHEVTKSQTQLSTHAQTNILRSKRGIHTATCKAPDNLLCIHMTSSNNPGSKGKDVASMPNHQGI